MFKPVLFWDGTLLTALRWHYRKSHWWRVRHSQYLLIETTTKKNNIHYLASFSFPHFDNAALTTAKHSENIVCPDDRAGVISFDSRCWKLLLFCDLIFKENLGITLAVKGAS